MATAKKTADPAPDNKLVKLGKLILKLKADLKRMEAEHEAATAQTKADIKLCTQLFAEQAHEAGVTNVGTEDGTVGISTRSFYKSDDIAALRDFALENNEVSLLTMTLSSSGLKEYMERTGETPPTVYQQEIEEVYIRPKKSKTALA